MSEKKLIEMGAECVCGDLILQRKTVGLYRDGAFLMTDDGRKLLDNIVENEAVMAALPSAEEPAAATTTTKAKGKAKAKAEPAPDLAPEPAKQDASNEDILAGLDLPA